MLDIRDSPGFHKIEKRKRKVRHLLRHIISTNFVEGFYDAVSCSGANNYETGSGR